MGKAQGPHPPERAGGLGGKPSRALRMNKSSTGQKTQGKGFGGRDHLRWGRPSVQGLCVQGTACLTVARLQKWAGQTTRKLSLKGQLRSLA